MSYNAYLIKEPFKATKEAFSEEVGPNLTNISGAQSKHSHFKGGRGEAGIRKKNNMKIRTKIKQDKY